MDSNKWEEYITTSTMRMLDFLVDFFQHKLKISSHLYLSPTSVDISLNQRKCFEEEHELSWGYITMAVLHTWLLIVNYTVIVINYAHNIINVQSLFLLCLQLLKDDTLSNIITTITIIG